MNLTAVKDGAIKDAKDTRVSVSLLLGVCLVAASYYAGERAGSKATAEQVKAIVAAQERQTVVFTEALGRLENSTKELDETLRRLELAQR